LQSLVDPFFCSGDRHSDLLAFQQFDVWKHATVIAGSGSCKAVAQRKSGEWI
jgi:hypothetical protein